MRSAAECCTAWTMLSIRRACTSELCFALLAEAALSPRTHTIVGVPGLTAVGDRAGMGFPKCRGEVGPVSYTHLTLPTNREV